VKSGCTFVAVAIAAATAALVSGCSPAVEGHTEPTQSPSMALSGPTSSPEPTTTPTVPTPITDSGPTPHASGKATATGKGELRYVVQPGDVGGAICDRFGRADWQGFLEDKNGAPKNGALSCSVFSYPGQVMILDRDTQEQADQRALMGL